MWLDLISTEIYYAAMEMSKHLSQIYINYAILRLLSSTGGVKMCLYHNNLQTNPFLHLISLHMFVLMEMGQFQQNQLRYIYSSVRNVK